MITVHDYYGESLPEILSLLIKSAISFGAVQKTFQYSYIEKDLSLRVSSIPFSKQVRPGQFRPPSSHSLITRYVSVFCSLVNVLAPYPQKQCPGGCVRDF